MKTIFITIPWFSPAYKAGGPIQSIINLVKEFSEGVQYKIFCGNTDLNNEPLAGIETGKWVAYNEYTDVWYATTHKRSDILLEQVNKCKPDILYIIGIYDWHFNIVPLVFCKVPVKIVSARGMLHPGALAEKGLKKKLFLNAWKVMGLHKKVWFHATDSAEEGFIKDTFGENARTRIAGNFPRLFTTNYRAPKQYGHLRMVSIALISPMKNHLMVLEAMKDFVYKIDYKIYGPVKDLRYWQECVALIETMPWNIKVSYEGDLRPEQVGWALEEAELFVLPSRSENFGHAIIEALSAGVPVLTSKNTPWNELQENNAGVNVDTDVASIKAALQELLAMDNGKYKYFSEAAVAYAHARVDVASLKEQYKIMFGL